MKQAEAPFHFVCASYLTRISPERAWTLSELVQHLQSVSEASIFYHTFQSLESRNYTNYSSDFAHWVMAGCNDAVLAERLGAFDLRQIVSLAELRKNLIAALENHLHNAPHAANRPAFEPFYFSEAVEIVVPLDKEARTLAGLADGIRMMSRHTLHFHFINSRLRLHLRTNDFSFWIRESLGFSELAEELDRIDFYTNSLEGIRQAVLASLQPWISR
ncbi:MAG: hypothetical protein HY648_05675 [Acidobacteria bacterium]|nr:hypothetical protein [Acidobacteriota bacterium]